MTIFTIVIVSAHPSLSPSLPPSLPHLGVHNKTSLPEQDVVDHHPPTRDGSHAIEAGELPGEGEGIRI